MSAALSEAASLAERLLTYREQGLQEVTGWFEPESAEVVSILLEHQLAQGVSGNIAEIGIHHGKSFLLLAQGVREGEQAVALDVFDDQDKNLDSSGRGDRRTFEANLARWAPGVDTRIVQSSSLDVAPAEAREVFGEVRLMSIDGGHTAEITLHDLRLAEACAEPSGIVMLDDLLNPLWLGVLTGFCSYLAAGPGLHPFALSPNKLYLAPSPDVGRHYAEHLRQALPDLIGGRLVEFFEHRVDVYGLGSRRRAVEAQRARRAQQESELERARLQMRLRAQRRRSRRLSRQLEDGNR